MKQSNKNFQLLVSRNRKPDLIQRLRALGIVDRISSVKQPYHHLINFKNDILVVTLEVEESNTRRILNKIQLEFLD